MANVAFVLTSHDAVGANGESTGVWLEELATPYYRLVDAGHNVTLSSVRGGAVPISPESLRPPAGTAATVQRWLSDKAASAVLASTGNVAALSASQLDAIVVPGGHGALWDLPSNAVVTALIETLLATGRCVAAICHGPAALVQARDANGQPCVAGRNVAAFTVAEERAAGLADDIPLLLENELRALGAHIVSAPAFEACAVRDDNLITAQNPASAEAFAEHMLAALAP
ncbi:MAG: type 1 glutamine amidotransferase domain-containing protein [Pseudomonadota bacterium]